MYLHKKDYLVKPIDLITAKRLVMKYHYAKSGSRIRVYTHGLFHKDNSFFEENCLGVAWWLPPTSKSARVTYPEGDFRKVLSLTRLVVHPKVPTNGASFLLSNSIKLIDKNKWECLVTYADTWQEHSGAIYRATNWEYMGLTKIPTPIFVNDKGKMMGKKRGKVNLTNKDMENMGFEYKGSFVKHKFRMIIGNFK